MILQKTQTAKTILSKRNNAGGITIPDLKICVTVIVIKIV